MKSVARSTLAVLAATSALAAGPSVAADANAQRAELRKMCDAALADLAKAKPELKGAIAKAPGYGCFTSFGMSFFVGGAGGSGLVYDNATKKTTYMKMAQASGGLDFGIKDYREVLVFRDAKSLEHFTTKGWEFSGSGTATATADGKGGSTEKGAITTDAVAVYPMTKTGIAVGVAAVGRKYWKDDELNK